MEPEKEATSEVASARAFHRPHRKRYAGENHQPAYLGPTVVPALEAPVTPPTPASESRPDLPSANGSHDLANYVTIFLALHQQRLSGVLETGTRRGWRRLYFLEGEVVNAASSFAQDSLGRSLAASGLVSKERIQWFEERLEPHEHIETALLASGALNAEQLTEHQQGRIRTGIAAPLRATSGSWRFETCPGLDPSSIAHALRPAVPCVAALWEGIRQHLAVDKVLPEVTDSSLGALVVGEGLRELLPSMELEPPLSFLGEAVSDGIGVEELFKQIPDRSGNLLKLVWFLERGGFLLRDDRPRDTNLCDRLTAVAEQAMEPAVHAAQLAWERHGQAESGEQPPPSPPAATTPLRVQAGPASPSSVDESETPRSVPADSEPPLISEPPARVALADGAPQISIGRFSSRASARGPASVGPTRSTARRSGRPYTAARVARDHTKRMPRDFYGFLGLKAGCPIDVVDRRCKHMLQQWTSAKELELDDETRRKLNQLLHGLQIVWQTLTHEDRKLEYDRRSQDGHAPQVEEIRRALEGGDQPDAEPSVPPDDALPSEGNVEFARRLIARGAFGAASRLLEKLRRDQPSDPDVLAELGWAVWKLRGTGGGKENKPEDYITLALTFSPSHIPSLEYHARIAFERGAHDALQDRLDRLLSADKQNAWALEVLASDALSTSSSRRSSGSGLRFWKRKSD